MQEELITFPTAQLAKEKGFPLLEIENKTDKLIPCPTQALLQKWLRKIHKIDIQVLRNKPGYDEYKVEIYQVFNADNYIHLIIKELDYIKWFDSYEEALEIGLQEALKLIKL